MEKPAGTVPSEADRKEAQAKAEKAAAKEAKKAEKAAAKDAVAKAKADEESEEPPFDPLATPTSPPALGSMVCYQQLENGPRVERCVSIVTGAHSATCLDLLVCRAGAPPRPLTSVVWGDGAGSWCALNCGPS